MWLSKEKQLACFREFFDTKKIGFCSGAFDLTHAGHVLFFRECKKYCDYLVVMVGLDKPITKRKGPNRPILNESVRLEMVTALRIVNFAFLDFENETDNEFATFDIVFPNLKPDIYFVNDDAFDIPSRQAICDKYGVTMKVLKRECPAEFENISTTKIIGKCATASIMSFNQIKVNDYFINQHVWGT